MKRSMTSVVAAAIGLGLTIPMVTATPALAAKTVKVKSSPTISGYDGDDINNVKFTGKVKANKQKKICRTKRKITLTQTDQGLVAGKAKTNKKGVWNLTFDGNRIDPGPFQVKVAKKAVKKKGKKIVCKGGKRNYTMDQLG